MNSPRWDSPRWVGANELEPRFAALETRIAALEMELLFARKNGLRRRFCNLPPTAFRLLRFLTREGSTGTSSYRQIWDHIYKDYKGDPPGMGNIRLHLFTIRHALMPHNIEMQTVHGYGITLSEPALTKVREMLAIYDKGLAAP